MNATEAVTPGARERPDILKMADLVKALRKERPNLFGKVPEKKAAALIKAAFAQLGKHVGSMNEGVVRVPGFGNFRVRQVEREKDGQKVTVTRTIFRAMKTKFKGKRQGAEKSKNKQNPADI